MSKPSMTHAAAEWTNFRFAAADSVPENRLEQIIPNLLGVIRDKDHRWYKGAR